MLTRWKEVGQQLLMVDFVVTGHKSFIILDN